MHHSESELEKPPTTPAATQPGDRPLFGANAGPEAWRAGETPPPRDLAALREAYDNYEAHKDDPESPPRSTPTAPQEQSMRPTLSEQRESKLQRRKLVKAKQAHRRGLLSRPAQWQRYAARLKAATFEVLLESDPGFDPEKPIRLELMEVAVAMATERLRKRGINQPR